MKWPRLLYLHKRTMRLLWVLCQPNKNTLYGIGCQHICLLSCLSISIWCYIRCGKLPWTPLSCHQSYGVRSLTSLHEVSGIVRCCWEISAIRSSSSSPPFSLELHWSSLCLTCGDLYDCEQPNLWQPMWSFDSISAPVLDLPHHCGFI